MLDAVAASGAQPVRGVEFDFAGVTVPVHVNPDGGVDALYAPRRTVLDRIVADAAEAEGVEMLWGQSVGEERQAA